MLSIISQYNSEPDRTYRSTHTDLGKQLSDIASFCSQYITDNRGNDYQGHWRIILPWYYRKCSEIATIPKDGGTAIREATAPLLKNMLKMIPNAVSGEGDFKDYFLCFEVADSWLPWDPNQDEWYF